MSSKRGQSVPAWIGIGANLEDPEVQLLSGIERLREASAVSVRGCSSLYRSDPMGPQDQPQYINAVIKVETELPPLALLDLLQSIENEAGRERTVRWGARTLDLDILLYDQLQLDSERLTIPHPGITVRSFVLVPLLELEPEITIPGLGGAEQFRASVENYGLIRLESSGAS